METKNSQTLRQKLKGYKAHPFSAIVAGGDGTSGSVDYFLCTDLFSSFYSGKRNQISHTGFVCFEIYDRECVAYACIG